MMHSQNLRVTLINTELSILPHIVINTCTIYVLNISRRKNIVSPLKTAMKLCADFNENIPEKTLCYVIMYGKKNLTYDAQQCNYSREFLNNINK